MRRFTLVIAVMITVVFANINTADAKCVALHGAGGVVHFPDYKVNGTKFMLLHDTQARTLFITTSDSKPATQCTPAVSFDSSKVTCSFKFERRSLEDFEVASGYRVVCKALPGVTDTKSVTVIRAGKETIRVKTYVFRKYDALLDMSLKLRGQVKALVPLFKNNHKRIIANRKLAEDAYKSASEAKARKSSNVSIETDFFLTVVHQGADFADYPAGGLGLNFTYWFWKGWKMFHVGVSTRLRWHRMMLTIEGAPQDSDVPGDQYELLANLSVRIRPASWLSFDVFGGVGPGFFHHQDMIANQDNGGTVSGPNGNVSVQALFNVGGGVNFHLKKWYFGARLNGTITPKGMLHPNYMGQAVWGVVKHFTVGAVFGYDL